MSIHKLLVGVAASLIIASVSRAAMNLDRVQDDTSGKKNASGSYSHSQHSQSEMKKSPCVCMSTDVIGTKVVSTQGEKLGKIEDVVINPSGEVSYAVVSFGGVAGIGDKYFAVPWSVLRSDAAKMEKEKSSERAFVLPLEKEKLKNAPGFDKSHWPTMVDSDWAKDVDTFYAGSPRTETNRPVEAGARVSAPIWKCSELKGFDVKSPSGEKLGDIKEVALDSSGRVCYAVISVGGFIGLGDRLVAVPWAALKTSRDASSDKRAIVLSSSKDQLKAAPQFDDSKEKRAEMCDPQWVGRVYEYYSVHPYWPRSEE